MTQRRTAWLKPGPWKQRAERLPGSWRQVALACLSGSLPASDILGSAFFPAFVRLAATWLAHIHQNREPVSLPQSSSCSFETAARTLFCGPLQAIWMRLLRGWTSSKLAASRPWRATWTLSPSVYQPSRICWPGWQPGINLAPQQLWQHC